MKTDSFSISDTDLDVALDRLEPPAPSETLRRRVETMAPESRRSPEIRRYATAAVLVLAIGAAGLLRLETPPQTAVAEAPPAQLVSEIEAEDLPLVDGLGPPERRETLSVAGLPLE